MRMLKVFESVTLNGYFSGTDGDIAWAHRYGADPELQAFTQDNARHAGTLLFGRVTYQMMESYWPTREAMQKDPVVAKGMNDAEKLVFSRTLAAADWNNTTLVKGDPAPMVRKLKQQDGDDLVVMGSGSLVRQLADADLVDEYQLVVMPVTLGKGRTLFAGIEKPLALELKISRTFTNGSLVLSYAPAK